MKTIYNQIITTRILGQYYTSLWLVLFSISITTIYAQSPQKMTYQSVVRDASGNLLANTIVGIQVSIVQGTTAGTNVYSETYSPNPQTNINGLVSLEIGTGTPSVGVFANIDWANGSFFLRVGIDPTGGTNYTVTGTSELLSVPYALYAETSGNAVADGSWSLSGNMGSDSTIDFIGTTDLQPLKFRVENEPFGELDIATHSIFFGERAGVSNIGADNIGIGTAVLIANTTGINNIGMGSQALLSNITGSNNIAMGDEVLLKNTVGTDNIGMGLRALTANTIGDDNIGIGNAALESNTTGGNNIGIGNTALDSNTTGIINIGIGIGALRSNTTGSFNVGIGDAALSSNITGTGNVGMGYNALYTTTGDHNIGLGYEALYYNTTGDHNIGIGELALTDNTTGSDNTAIGFNALSNNTIGSNNIGIGFNAEVPDPVTSNQIRIGNDQITYAGIQVDWSITSDKKWKEQIRSLPYGLDFVSQLKPVDYVRKNNETKTREIGFIAQDVKNLLTTVGYSDQGLLSKDSKGNLSLRYNDFIPLLTKAVQELNANNKSLQKMNIELVKRIEKLEQKK
ncbi:tail fiber domain-containing protein [Winogradskyella sp. R77965]|uniref:tail fiber domain-containing protein n=1 Tax=Winogradskyella sp. R77965 TaxID=3093872 RepID=UPI0037DC0BCF